MRQWRMAFGPSGGALSASSEANRNYNPNSYRGVSPAPGAPRLASMGTARAPTGGMMGSPRPDRGVGGVPRMLPGRTPTGPLTSPGQWTPPGRSTTGGIGGLTARAGQGGNMLWSNAAGQNQYYRSGPTGRIWDYTNRGWASPQLSAQLQQRIPTGPVLPGGGFPRGPVPPRGVPGTTPPGPWTPPPRTVPGTTPAGPWTPPRRSPPIYNPGGGGGWDGGRMPTIPGGFPGGINPGGMYNQPRQMLPPPSALGLNNQSLGLPAATYPGR